MHHDDIILICIQIVIMYLTQMRVCGNNYMEWWQA